jgi:ribosome-associated translation inhibitor RaiA
VIFDNSFRFFKGEDSYFKKMKKDFFTSNNVDKTIKIFIIELDGSESNSDVTLLIKKISEKFFKQLERDVKGEAPYIFIRNIDSEEIIKIKEELVETKLIFRDGYDFLNSKFNLISITSKSSKENRISLKLINSETELNQVIDFNFNTLKEVYQFFKSKPIEITQDIKETNIEIQNSNEILNIM